MKLHFAGGETEVYDNLLSKFNVKRRLKSFYHIKKNPVGSGDVLIDSGGFTARTKGVPISVEEYAKFLRENNIKHAFNLDTNDLDETLRNQEYLEKNTRTYIIPIYHLSDYLDCRDLLLKFLKYPYISTGGTVGIKSEWRQYLEEFFDHTFYHTRDKIRVHGLGVTRETWLKRYPFYSVDSTSWLTSARFGGSSVLGDRKLIAFRNQNRSYQDRTELEIKHFLRLEYEVTQFWTARGITWSDFTYEK